MPGKIDAYNLGDLGVDLVSSPLHSDDGTLLLAQNVIVEPIRGQHAIAKRPGHTKITATAAAGALLGICPIPFADPSSPGLTGDAIVRRVGGGLEYSLDGTTWVASLLTFGTTPDYPSTLQNRTLRRLYYIDNAQLYYLSAAAGQPPAKTFVGATGGSSGTSICAVEPDEVYIAAASPGTWLLYVWDGSTVTQISVDPWDHAGIPWLPFHFDGDVFCASLTTGASGEIYRYTGGTSWAVDAARTDVNSVSKWAIYHGRLYACMKVTGTPDGSIDKILVREAGAWSSVHDAAGDFYGLCAFDEKLFVVRDSGTAAEVWVSTDGATFTLDEDLTASFGVTAGEGDLVGWNGHLYCIIDGDAVFQRTTAGVWAEVDATASFGIFLGAY
jgi:hypothetical protein